VRLLGSDTVNDSPLELNAQLMRRVQHEYLEMPGLQLTLQQAQRLWGLETAVCETLLNELVELNFLSRRPDGKFGRFSEGNGLSLPLRMARATLDDKPRTPRKQSA
jgi:hypothetical protein